MRYTVHFFLILFCHKYIKVQNIKKHHFTKFQKNFIHQVRLEGLSKIVTFYFFY